MQRAVTSTEPPRTLRPPRRSPPEARSFEEFLGLRIVSSNGQRAKIIFPPREDFSNGIGMIHGGVTAAAGIMAGRKIFPGTISLPQSFHIEYDGAGTRNQSISSTSKVRARRVGDPPNSFRTEFQVFSGKSAKPIAHGECLYLKLMPGNSVTSHKAAPKEAFKSKVIFPTKKTNNVFTAELRPEVVEQDDASSTIVAFKSKSWAKDKDLDIIDPALIAAYCDSAMGAYSMPRYFPKGLVTPTACLEMEFGNPVAEDAELFFSSTIKSDEKCGTGRFEDDRRMLIETDMHLSPERKGPIVANARGIFRKFPKERLVKMGYELGDLSQLNENLA